MIGGDLQHEGELVGVGRHLTSEAGQTDAEEDDDLLAHRPILHRRIEVSEAHGIHHVLYRQRRVCGSATTASVAYQWVLRVIAGLWNQNEGLILLLGELRGFQASRGDIWRPLQLVGARITCRHDGDVCSTTFKIL